MSRPGRNSARYKVYQEGFCFWWVTQASIGATLISHCHRHPVSALWQVCNEVCLVVIDLNFAKEFICFGERGRKVYEKRLRVFFT